ncbi:MAG: hypothetical protein IPH22_08365 [Nitrosomonas sp.]|nr:hypothetical protein [Nitrosomonas sp.]
MKNFSAVSYQTDSQALITKQTNPFQHQTWKQRQQYWKKKFVPGLNIKLNVATNIAVLFTVHYKPAVAYKLP